MTEIIPQDIIDQKILLIRGLRVMIDADLASIYGVTTKRLNEQVKRNKKRFPNDFMFQLNKKEKSEVVANCDHLKNLKFSPNMPFVFTEHGAIMLATVLSSPVAIDASIQVVRAFVKLREILSTHKKLALKMQQLEKKIESQDEKIYTIFNAINSLMAPPEKNKRKIGFKRGKE
jgi:phage regulator Rha-like protein